MEDNQDVTLGEFRGNMKITQVKLAELLGIRPDTAAKWENKPLEDLEGKQIRNLAKHFGMTTDEVLGYKKPDLEPLKPEHTFIKVDELREKISTRIQQRKNVSDSEESGKNEVYDNYNAFLREVTKKPKIALFGGYDVGKSTLINALVGNDKLPVAWRPTTAIIILVRQKPNGVNSECMVLRYRKDEEGSEEFNPDWFDDNPDKLKELCIAEGSVELLNLYGTRNGRKEGREKEREEAAAAILYVDSDILRNVDIIDLPGFRDWGELGVHDDRVAKELLYNNHTYHAAVYLSRANGFFTEMRDGEQLMSVIEHLPWLEKKGENEIKPFGNLFIIASQAHTVDGGNQSSLEEIYKDAYADILSLLPVTVIKERSEYSGYSIEEYHSYLGKRFFSYSTNNEAINESFNTSLTELLQEMTDVVYKEAKEELLKYAKASMDAITDELETLSAIRNEWREKEGELVEIENNEETRKEKNQKRKLEVREKIERFKERSNSEFTDK